MLPLPIFPKVLTVLRAQRLQDESNKHYTFSGGINKRLVCGGGCFLQESGMDLKRPRIYNTVSFNVIKSIFFHFVEKMQINAVQHCDAQFTFTLNLIETLQISF